MGEATLTLGDLRRGDTFEFADEDHLLGWCVYLMRGVIDGGAVYEVQMTDRLMMGETTFDVTLGRPVKNVERATD